MVGGDLQNDRYSSLTQITPANVGKLTLAWHIHLGECAAYQAASSGACAWRPRGLSGTGGRTPLSSTGSCTSRSSLSNVYAIDATTGNVLWTYVPTFDPGFSIGSGGRQPGVSVGQGLVFLGQRDGKIVALNQGNGSVAWTASTGPWQKGIRLSETPIYYNGEVIEGTTGSDGGSTSNNMEAFNATTGAAALGVQQHPVAQPAGR